MRNTDPRARHGIYTYLEIANKNCRSKPTQGTSFSCKIFFSHWWKITLSQKIDFKWCRMCVLTIGSDSLKTYTGRILLTHNIKRSWKFALSEKINFQSSWMYMLKKLFEHPNIVWRQTSFLQKICLRWFWKITFSEKIDFKSFRSAFWQVVSQPQNLDRQTSFSKKIVFESFWMREICRSSL